MPETIKANVTLARSDIGWFSWLSAFSARATGTRDSQTLLDVSPSLQAGICPEFSEAARRPLLSRQRSEPVRGILWVDQRTRSLVGLCATIAQSLQGLLIAIPTASW